MRIICCGDPQRGDDGAGPLVVQRLAALGIQAMEHSGEPLDLMAAWSGACEVILVDAAVSGAPAGTVHELNDRNIPPALRSASTHGLGLAEAIELARCLGRLPERLRIYGIEGARFRVGSPMSPPVVRACHELAARIAAELSAKFKKQL